MHEPQMLEFCRIEEGHDKVLLSPAADVTFPLSREMKNFIADLSHTFHNTENCAGLAAPQVNKSVRIFVAGLGEVVKQYRDDMYDVLPFTVFINPSYEPIGEESRPDWEGCFSVRDMVGQVHRYKRIKFRYQNEQGEVIEKEVEGFIARLLQHETDHTLGILCNSKYDMNLPHGTFEEIKALREKQRAEKMQKAQE